MKHIMCGLLALGLPCLSTAQDKRAAFLTADESGPDFDVQGEYSGTVDGDGNSTKIGIQVIAQGDGKFRSVGYIGGLPGDGWDGTAEKRIPGSGHMQDDICILKADNVDSDGRAEIKDGNLTLYSGDNVKVAEFPKVRRESPTVGKTPSAGAVVLFDGTTAEHFQGGRMSEDKLLMEGVTSKQRFGSYNLHIEFMLSFMPHARGQGRANSGCYQQGRYEVQILDSFGLEGKNNECGGVYEIADPAVNMCFPPLSWQTYDIEYHAAKFADDGQKKKNSWMTVKHNGVVVHDKLDLPRGTRAAPVKEGPEDGPIYLQNHGNPIRFRNIWLMPIED
ncbi:MAG: DUF1080 domain-containing protein [Fuerstiella sp.]|nr:DUF1080 domain-containing protein [Fuerstiella sp.]